MGINIVDTPVYMEKKNNEKQIINAVMLFMAIYGCVTYFLTALKIDYYSFILIPVFGLISVGCAYIHKSKKTMIIGYIVILMVYAVYVLGCSAIINSGFSHCLNVLYQTVDNRYVLGIEREYAEVFENSTMSVTMLAIAVGFALAMMINMLISESMNGFAIAFLEVWFWLIPFYFGYEGATVSCIMSLLVPIVVTIIKNTHRFGLHDNNVSYRNSPPKNLAEKLVRKVRKESKKSFENTYTRKGYFRARVMPKVVARQMASVGVVVAVIAIATMLVVPKSIYSGTGNPVEQAIRKPVQEFAMYGFQALWGNRNVASGSVMDGKIFDSGFVRFDYSTDLLVRFQPRNQERVLLKGYTGVYYTGDRWATTGAWSAYEGREDDIHSFEYFLRKKYNLEGAELSRTISEASQSTALGLKEYFEKNDDPDVYDAYMYIQKATPLENTFVPYYTYYDQSSDGGASIEDDDADGIAQTDSDVWSPESSESIQASYYYTDDFETYINSHEITEVEKMYGQYVRHTFLDNSSVAAYAGNEFMKEYNLSPIYGDANPDIYYEINGFDAEKEFEVVESLYDIFESDYRYTLVPGRTPKDRDYAEYFLMTNKKGYCVHFATAAVIILRQMGIPARYCEGYALDPESWGSIEDERGSISKIHDASELIELTAQTDYNDALYGMVEAKITDEYGHAWIEVYADGIGWCPVDITPPSYDDEEDDEQQQSPLMNMLTGVAGGVSAVGGGIASLFGIAADNKLAIMVFVAAVIILVIACWILSMFILRIMRRRRFNSTDVDRAVYAIAEYARKLLRLGGFDKQEVYTFMECAVKAREKNNIELADAIEILVPVQKMTYGGYHLNDGERKRALDGLASLSRCIYESLKWYQKIVFIFIRRMSVVKVNDMAVPTQKDM